nr:hypothetical protein [Providencia stuartii]ELR5082446.1 hypothetical protein [Providencia stuartii]
MKKLLIFIFTIFASYSVNAAWITNVEESIFGDNKANMIGEIKNSKAAIVFQCDKDNLRISYVELGSDKKINPTPVTLLMKIDDGNVIDFQAVLGRKNSEAVAATADDKEKIILLLQQLKIAKKKFLAGISVDDSDFKQSFSGNVSGSTTAVNKFITACNINL